MHTQPQGCTWPRTITVHSGKAFLPGSLVGSGPRDPRTLAGGHWGALLQHLLSALETPHEVFTRIPCSCSWDPNKSHLASCVTLFTHDSHTMEKKGPRPEEVEITFSMIFGGPMESESELNAL